MTHVIVIGAGPAGYVAAIRAAQLGMKTTLIEKRKSLGGTCLNVGCIPSKSLLQSTDHYHWLCHAAKEHGIRIKNVDIDFEVMMQRKQKVVEGLVADVDGLMKKNKISVIQGSACFVDPQTLEVNGKKLHADNFILATGSEPVELPFLKFDEEKILSSTGALSLKKIPKKLIVIGAGVIGVEMGSVYCRLGTEVLFIEMMGSICLGIDIKTARAFQSILQKQGMKFLLGAKVLKGEKKQEGIQITFEHEGKESQENADCVLVAVGRRPYVEGLNLEAAGIDKTDRGYIAVDANFRTSQPHIYAIGDLIGGAMLAHKASEEGVAVAEILAGQTPHLNYIAIPNVIYTHPEVATIGLTEEETDKAGIEIVTKSFPFRANPRARCAGDLEGSVKLLADKKSNRLIGMHIIGPQASELIHEGVIAIEKGMTIHELGRICHAHPTLSEAIKEAAGL